MTPEQFAEFIQVLKAVSANISCMTGVVGAYFFGRIFGLWK